MSSSQIDRLCQDWLRENYGEAIVSKYMTYSLVIPILNPAELNEALEDLRLRLCFAFGPEKSFGSIDYYDAREKVRLRDDRIPVPDVFVRAFATK